jgi:Family of unknown function (DUF6074)
MTATVLPFPIARRRTFIAKQASHAALMNPDAGVRYLQSQIKLQGDAMRRKGVDEDLVQRELQCMANAIGTEFINDRVGQPEN